MNKGRIIVTTPVEKDDRPALRTAAIEAKQGLPALERLELELLAMEQANAIDVAMPIVRPCEPDVHIYSLNATVDRVQRLGIVLVVDLE